MAVPPGVRMTGPERRRARVCETWGPVMPSDPIPARRPRHHLVLVTAPIIVLLLAANLGNALAPSLVLDHPLLLIALNPSNRNFIFVAARVDPVSYYVVGTLRLLAPDPFFYLLGRWYGEAAITWMERRTPTYGQLMRTLERWFAKARWPLVTAIPNNPVCLLAGASAMAVGVFVVLDVVGTIARLVLLRVLGQTFQAPIDWLLLIINEYRYPLLAVTIAAVGFTMLREWRAGTSEIEQLIDLEPALDEAAEEGAAESAGPTTDPPEPA